MYVCVYIYVRVCVCVCVCKQRWRLVQKVLSLKKILNLSNTNHLCMSTEFKT